MAHHSLYRDDQMLYLQPHPAYQQDRLLPKGVTVVPQTSIQVAFGLRLYLRQASGLLLEVHPRRLLDLRLAMVAKVRAKICPLSWHPPQPVQQASIAIGLYLDIRGYAAMESLAHPPKEKKPP